MALVEGSEVMEIEIGFASVVLASSATPAFCADSTASFPNTAESASPAEIAKVTTTNTMGCFDSGVRVQDDEGATFLPHQLCKDRDCWFELL
jgi:hypothetical protein